MKISYRCVCVSTAAGLGMDSANENTATLKTTCPHSLAWCQPVHMSGVEPKEWAGYILFMKHKVTCLCLINKGDREGYYLASPICGRDSPQIGE